MLILRRPARKNSGQLPPMENRQLMQRARCRNIQQLYMTVVRRIFFLRRVKQKYRVKLQPFRVGYRKHHDAVPELLRLSFCAVLYRNVLCQPSRNPLCLLFIPTDHRDVSYPFLCQPCIVSAARLSSARSPCTGSTQTPAPWRMIGSTG